jgi:uncharacterized protein YecE (DUF72 family)
MPPEGRYNFRHYGPVPLSFDPVRHLRWTYHGWQGQVYTRQYPENKFVQDCLGEYCQYEYQGEPLFRTVGNDATFYRPPTANQLRRYLSQIPEDFQMCLRCGRDHHSELRKAASVWSRSGSAEAMVSRC